MAVSTHEITDKHVTDISNEGVTTWAKFWYIAVVIGFPFTVFHDVLHRDGRAWIVEVDYLRLRAVNNMYGTQLSYASNN
jgi:hypothetical protein